MAVGPIPYTAISEWARRNGVRDFSRFHALIHYMDGVFLKHNTSETK